MSNMTGEIREQTRLRRVAEALLAEGEAPPTRGWELGTDALALLYRLASDVDGSGDALAVLHELQVHQVELDLQLEQLETNEEELTAELERYRNRYEHAPVGHLLLCPEGRILETNATARQMLASIANEATGRPEGTRFADLIRPEDQPALAAMLRQLVDESAIAACEVQALHGRADAPKLRVTARGEPGTHNLWLVMS